METTATITRIQSGETDKKFIFLSGELKNMDDTTNILSISIDFPKEDITDKDDSFTLNLGAETELSLSFKLYTQTEDRSVGTHSEVKTFQQIFPYLKAKMFKPAVGEVLYKIQLTTKFESIDAYFELKDFNIGTGSGIYPEGNIKFKLRGYEKSGYYA
jgi:hypothetical protein